jgi:hypothetical protein
MDKFKLLNSSNNIVSKIESESTPTNTTTPQMSPQHAQKQQPFVLPPLNPSVDPTGQDFISKLLMLPHSTLEQVPSLVRNLAALAHYNRAKELIQSVIKIQEE